MTRYTLIIPHHNIPTLLDRLLQTVSRRDDMQVIVVDDCSTEQLDQLEEVKNKYPWVEWYSTDTNGGGGKARNVGLEHAIGDYLIFADADDYFLPAFDNLLNEYKDKEFDILYFSAYENNPKKTKQAYVSKLLEGIIKCGNVSNVKFHLDQTWSKIINRQIVKKNGIKFQETIVSNDVIFSTYVDVYAKDIQISQIKAYVYDIRENSTHFPYTRFKNFISIDVLFEKREIIRYHGVMQMGIELYLMSNLLSYILHYKFSGLREIMSLLRKYKFKNHDLIRIYIIYIISKMVFFDKWGWESRSKLKNLLSVNRPI